MGLLSSAEKTGSHTAGPAPPTGALGGTDPFLPQPLMAKAVPSQQAALGPLPFGAEENST